MAIEETIIMNSRGMITIPKYFRQKLKLKPGMQFCIMEIDGVLSIIPILSKEELKQDLIPHEELVQIFDEDRQRSLELEK